MIAPDPAPSRLEVWDWLLIAAMAITSLPILFRMIMALCHG